MKRMYICVFVIYFWNLASGQIVFPGEDEESIIRRRLNLQPQTRTNSNPFGPCQISPGECLPYKQCPELRSLVSQNGLTDRMIGFLKSRLCAVSATRFRLCCNTGQSPFSRPLQQPTPTIASTFSPSVRPRDPSRNENLIPTENDCGYATTNRIIQGEKFPHGEHPWLVGLGTVSSNGKFRLQCGGALITRRHVLSASHCFVTQGGPQTITHVILGEHSLSRNTEKEPPIIQRIIRKTSPGYNDRSHINDLELIEMEGDVDYTGFIRPVCLPFDYQNNEFIGQKMTIIGWGDTFFRSMQGSDLPLKAKVSIIPRQECNNAYSRSPVINIGREQICASSFQQDACQGDSGGPFLYEGRRTYLIGVVSFGVDCAGGVFPGVYTFIPNYLRWIQQNL